MDKPANNSNLLRPIGSWWTLLGTAAALGVWACTPRAEVPVGHCLDLPEDETPVVAQVGSVPLTVEQMVRLLRERGSAATRRYASRDALREFVEDQIRMELLTRAGVERGLHRDPEVVMAARKVLVRKLLHSDLGASVFAGKMAEARVRRYYEAHREDYVQPEKRRLLHILLAPNESGHALAGDILAQLQERPDDAALFESLMRKYTRDRDSRSMGGEIPFKSREELTEELGLSFASEVFRLPTGNLAPEPLQSTRGWHVVRVVSQREALARPLEEVREDILERLLISHRAKHFDDYLAEIRKRHPVALHEERLDELLAVITGGATTESP